MKFWRASADRVVPRRKKWERTKGMRRVAGQTTGRKTHATHFDDGNEGGYASGAMEASLSMT